MCIFFPPLKGSLTHLQTHQIFHESLLHVASDIRRVNLSVRRVAGRRGPSMMTRYARSYSLQKGPSLEDSVE